MKKQRLVGNALLQQSLKSWQPLMTPRCVILCFSLVGAAFVGLGVVLLIASNNIVVLSKDYTNLVSTGTTGVISFTVTTAMAAPVFLYTEMTNYFQNHRLYVKSRSDTQLSAGDSVSTSSSSYSSACDPLTTTTTGTSVSVLKYPCGGVATTVFNDTYFLSVQASGGSEGVLTLDESASTIAWATDVDKRFFNANPNTVSGGSALWKQMDMWLLKYFPPYVCVPTSYPPASYFDSSSTAYPSVDMVTADSTSGTTYPSCDASAYTASPSTSGTCSISSCPSGFSIVANPSGWGVQNGHFINWMRTAALPSFRKLYARINRSLNVGDVVKVYIVSRYPVAQYGGTKSVVLSTVSWFGGSNSFIGIAYIVVGSISLLFAIFYAVGHVMNAKRFDSVDSLDWGGGVANRSAPARMAVTTHEHQS